MRGYANGCAPAGLGVRTCDLYGINREAAPVASTLLSESHYARPVTWTEPHYNKSHVSRAGKTFVNPAASWEERALARAVVNNWRSSHAYPLNTVQMTLRQRARKIEAEPIVAQRTKRLPSIRTKLERFPKMELARMQDIAGCRAVLESVESVRQVERMYVHPSRNNSQRVVRHDDYITIPKPDGYRGVHVVVDYHGQQQKSWDGLKVEIQIRTRLMHAWATALETVDTFTRQQLKAGRGQADWRRFFALMSSQIAFIEDCPPVPGMPTSPSDIRGELAQQARDLQVIERLESYAQTLQVFSDSRDASLRWFLLRLDLGERRLHLTRYSNPVQAEEAYGQLEASEDVSGGDEQDVVLVAVSSVDALQRAYPNYFLDTGVFLELVRNAITPAR